MKNETLPQDPELDAKKTTENAVENANSGQDGGENVEPSISLADLNKKLGKDFKDKETALKSLKDTQSFVGKKIEVKTDPTIQEQLDNLSSELKESNFYKDNPQYNNETTKKLIKGLGDNPEEVVSGDVFKEIYEKTSAYDKSQESKSILHNSSRLGQATTKIDDANSAMAKANDAAAKGNITEALNSQRVAEAGAVESVIDSFEK